jgi:type II secretory pathway pseudopilin PulG
MMSPSQKEHDKIFNMSQPCHLRILNAHRASCPSNEAGYTLVALIALMALMALFAMAAAPSILQQSQREGEKEAIFRGEEVADAIRIYYNAQLRNGRPAGDSALPTSMDQLVEGVPIAGRTKKLQILRASAARDPLSSTGGWSLVRPHSPEITDFVRGLMLYAGNVRPPTSDPQLNAQALFMAPPVIAISGLSSSSASTGSGLTSISTGPFIGVSSSSKHDSVITYYGIERHDQWVFTPLFR